jgi:tRNA threonylcarbamoyladenosine biosynthesis protein TsaB
MPPLSALQKPIPEEVVEVGDGVDFFAGLDCRIRHASKPHGEVTPLSLENHVTGADVAVAGLTHGANIDHRLRGRQLPTPLLLTVPKLRRLKLRVRSEDAGDVRVALEAVLLHQFEDVLDFERIVDVFGEDVLVERPPGRPVHKLACPIGVCAGQFAEEVRERVICIPRETVVSLKLRPRPTDRPLRAHVETVGVEERPLIVVAQEHHLAAVSNDRDALAWVGSIPHHITKAEDFFHALLIDILQHRLERLEVAVDVAKNGPLHARLQLWGDFQQGILIGPNPLENPMPSIPSSFARVIAIDTSLPRGSVAAFNPHHSAPETDTTATADDAVFSEIFETPADHARLLAGGVERTCQAAGWPPREADLVGVVVGPGSFTGLRVGVTAAKMLAWASGCQLVGISSFALLAGEADAWVRAAYPEATQLHLALDAGRGEVHATTATRAFGTPFDWAIADSQLLPVDAWIEALPPAAVVVSPLENDALIHRSDLCRPAAAPQRPRAATAAWLAVRLAAAGLFADAATLTPSYLRPSYAEEPRRR